MTRVLAVDLGATSVRVAVVELDTATPAVEVVHRWHHSPFNAADGTLRWDWPRIVSEVEKGLALGIAEGPVASIGVDGWGVDYGLIDGAGDLVSLPFSYRDGRTKNWLTTADRIGVDRLYQITGVQLLSFNTIFQLAVHHPAEMQQARRILLLPDLLVRHLGGMEWAERSNASTTSLLDARTGDWSTELIEELSMTRSLFPPMHRATEAAGQWRRIPLHLVGSHDTASAFFGMPGGLSAGTVFVSTGTWVIVGVERSEVDTSETARRLNFSNEAGALGGFRFLRNVVGFWLLERCRIDWGSPPLHLLMDEAATVTESVPLFDAADERFLNPAHMVNEVLAATGLTAKTRRNVIVRSVLESIVEGIARVIEDIRRITGSNPSQVALVGGASLAPIIPELVSLRTGLPVIKGSSEATALGNAIVQGIALGHFADAKQARSWLDLTGQRV